MGITADRITRPRRRGAARAAERRASRPADDGGRSQGGAARASRRRRGAEHHGAARGATCAPTLGASTSRAERPWARLLGRVVQPAEPQATRRARAGCDADRRAAPQSAGAAHGALRRIFEVGSIPLSCSTPLQRLADRASRPRLRAVHVDHGLNPQSPQWSIRCGEVATALGIDCRRLAIDARSPRREAQKPGRAARAVRRSPPTSRRRSPAHRARGRPAGNGAAATAARRRDRPASPACRGWRRSAGAGSCARCSSSRVVRSIAGQLPPGSIGSKTDESRPDVRSQLPASFGAAQPACALATGDAHGRPGGCATAKTVELAAVLAESDFASVREGLALPIAALGALSEPPTARCCARGSRATICRCRRYGRWRPCAGTCGLPPTTAFPAHAGRKHDVYRYQGPAVRRQVASAGRRGGTEMTVGGCDPRRGRASRASGLRSAVG